MIEEKFYADIHVHSTFKPYLSLGVESPWEDFKNTTDEKLTTRTTQFTRSDFPSLLESNTRLIGLSIHTLERFSMTRIFTQPAILAKFLKFDLAKLRKVLSNQPFMVFQNELELLKNSLQNPNGKGEVVIAKNYEHVQNIISIPHQIAALLCIEGSHCLGFEYFDEDFPGNSTKIMKAEIPSMELIRERVDFMKKENVFMLTLNHFVYNHLSSMPKAIELTGLKKIIKNPISTLNNLGKYRGLTFWGQYMVELCFENNIFIDVKHCDAMTRFQIYEIAKRYKIPVIASHAAVSGRPTNIKNHVLEHIEDRTVDRTKAEMFNPWDINMHDDDILAIHKSEGLFGIILDRRVLSSEKIYNKIVKEQLNWSILVYNQIEYYYKTLVNKGIDPTEAFNSMCIGSDFDGMIEPIHTCVSAKEYPKLEKDLIQFVEINYEIFKASELSPSAIMNKIFKTNVVDFLKKYYK